MNRLRFWRLERGLSQIELAEASGLTRWKIQLFEIGLREPTPEERAAMADALGVTINQIALVVKEQLHHD